jgi:hypothetical protein
MGMAGADEPSDANGAGPSARGRTGLYYLPPPAQRSQPAGHSRINDHGTDLERHKFSPPIGVG